MSDQGAEGRPNRLCLGPEHIVPIVVGRAEALDGGMQGDHGVSHGVTGGIGVEAAVDPATVIQQGPQPARVGAGAGGGETTALGMEGHAADGVDGRFAQDHPWPGCGGNGEATQILLGAGCQAVPSPLGGAAKLGADGAVMLVSQQENSIGSGIGIDGAGVYEWRHQHRGQAALGDQVVSDADQLAGNRRWEL